MLRSIIQPWPHQAPSGRPAPAVPRDPPALSVPQAARLWLVASLALWVLLALPVRLFLLG